MAQVIRKQVFDQLSAANGTVTFPPSNWLPTGELDGLDVCIEVAGAASGSVTSSTKRDDTSTITIKTGTGLVVGTDWSYSLSDFFAPTASLPACLPPWFKMVATAAGGGTIRVTVWAIKRQ